MIKINLRHYYPHYTSDVFIEVPDDIAIELHTFENEDVAYRMRRSRNRAFYSLDREDGLERGMQISTPSSLNTVMVGIRGYRLRLGQVDYIVVFNFVLTCSRSPTGVGLFESTKNYSRITYPK